MKNHHFKGRIETLESCRAQLRAICHDERWVVSDIDEGYFNVHEDVLEIRN